MGKRILLVDQFGKITGGQVVLQALISAAHDGGYSVGVLAPMGGTLESTLRATWGDKVDLFHLDEPRFTSGRKGIRDVVRMAAYCGYVLRFWRLVSGYDAVYVNGGRLALPFFLLSLLTKMPRWFYHVHLCHSGIEKRLLALVAASSRTSHVIMASSYIRDEFARANGVFSQNSNVSVVQNCLVHPFNDLAERDRFTGDAGPLTVALIGRVSPVKGHDVLPGLARRFPDLRFVVIGSVAEENRAFFDGLFADAPANLVYGGETGDLLGTLDEYNVQLSLVPSRWDEPFGLVSIESMAASCLTLVSNRGMLPHIARTTGAFCFQSDAELVEMLERFRTAPRSLLQRLAREQYQKAQRFFGFDDFRRQVLAILDLRAQG
jgi:glycosyltransferase involved in cell wall biosynthesis